MKRRDFLVGSSTAITFFSAGCSEAESDENREEYTFNLYNTADQSHAFEVEIGGQNRANGVYDETHELAAGKAKEDISIDGPPASIEVTIDSTIEHSFPWPASYHELGTAALVASIWYRPGQKQEVYVHAD